MTDEENGGDSDLFSTILYWIVKMGLIICIFIVIAVFILLVTNHKE